MEDNEDKTLIHWQFKICKCEQVVPAPLSAQRTTIKPSVSIQCQPDDDFLIHMKEKSQSVDIAWATIYMRKTLS